MLDWERHHETIENEKHIDTNARNKNDFESKIDLEADLTDPLLSKTDCDNL
ncbi:12382_t:CDS:1, partial [Racocetra fulgida]